MHDPVVSHLASVVGAPRAVDRRRFVVTSLSAGFALAALPVSAQTITTSAEGLLAGEVKVPVRDGEIPAYRAMPATGGPFPAILVVHEVFGVHEWIKDVCRRLAHLGYYAIAPALYAREGDPMKAEEMGTLLQLVRKVPDAQVMSDLDAAAAYAKTTGKADTTRLGVTGFCWGGRIVWLYAEHAPALKAAVAWYGSVDSAFHAGDRTALDGVQRLQAPVLGLYAGHDNITQASLDRMREAARNAGRTVEIVVYPDAEHGFLADYRPSYDKAAAEAGWKRMSDWFAKYL